MNPRTRFHRLQYSHTISALINYYTQSGHLQKLICALKIKPTDAEKQTP